MTMFTRERFGNFALVGNLSLLLLVWRGIAVLEWLYDVYQGQAPCDLVTAAINTVSALLVVPSHLTFPMRPIDYDDLWRMSRHIACISLSKRLAGPHSIMIIVCTYYPPLDVVKRYVSPLLLLAPVFYWWYLSLRGSMIIDAVPQRAWHVDQATLLASAAAA